MLDTQESPAAVNVEKVATAQATEAARSIADESPDGLPRMTKIIVAIHGIGCQLRSDTIRAVARQFGSLRDKPLPVMPLGYFNLGSDAEVRVSRLDVEPADPLAAIGFAEVYWADIPEQVVKANDTLEETKAWGRTVVSRAEKEYRDRVDGELESVDFELGIGAIDEIVETIDVLENLLAVFGRMGLFKFELAPLLRDYVGDVQLVTDFPYYRRKILYRFHDTLAQIVATFRKLAPGHEPEIYIVAHSEGTVISFLGLLQAMSGEVVTDPDARATDARPAGSPIDTTWVSHVRGYLTMGSPIDKHLVLWPKLFARMRLACHQMPDGSIAFAPPKGQPGQGLVLRRPIQWRNYYDLGDPIGFKLDTTLAWLDEQQCRAFDFDSRHDHGFSRYLLPGKAHNDYWNDATVFRHFIDDVVLPGRPAVAPASLPLVDKISLAIPYFATFALHVGAVFPLYSTVVGTNELDNVDRLPLQILLLSMLLTSITVAARLPRLVKSAGPRWPLAAFFALVAGAGTCAWLLPSGPAEFLGGVFIGWLPADVLSNTPQAELARRCAVFAAAVVIAASGWLSPRRTALGRRLLMAAGVLMIAFIVITRLAGSQHAPVWPLLLAGAAFLYLWWLGVLVFDLTFLWHRYIRRSVAVDTLAAWKARQDVEPNAWMGLGKASGRAGP